MKEYGPHHIPLYLTYLTFGEEMWRMTVNYHKFIQLLTPVAAAAPDMALSLEQINTSPNT